VPPPSLAALILFLAQTPARQLPGAGPAAAARPPQLEQRLLETFAARLPDQDPRTEHLFADGTPRYVNRLILEDSVYLLQHAHNPVDWHPWGPEAFARAAREGKPVFLSIGYSTCHWCHVMERESFDDEEVARILNEHFVSIKVDRERRPDVDELYMAAAQMTSGHGGWPLSSFLTPAGKPFFAATYFPRDRFVALLERVTELWQSRRDQLERDAQRLSDAVSELVAAHSAASELDEALVELAVKRLLERHDSQLGGFSPAPKFPQESSLQLLLQRSRRGYAGGDDALADSALAAAQTTLLAMARGGIHDQVGGGFHRYSTDTRWLVPHFEKMLYNQALLARAYLAAYDATGNAPYQRVARQTLDYVLREMADPQGGFYSATDADSEGREGAYFVWTLDELRQALGPRLAPLAIEVYGVTPEGNFDGRSILHLPRPLGEVARRRGVSLDALLAELETIRSRLQEIRSARVAPLRDDKLITAWNGMVVATLAEASQILGDSTYLEHAERTAELFWQRRRVSEETVGLWRIHLDGASTVPGLLEDYAWLGESFVSLYDASGDHRWLERASALAAASIERFWDPEAGGFFVSESRADSVLIARAKSPADGAVPSGNSTAVRLLGRLAARTGEPRFRQRAEATIAAFAGSIGRAPAAFSYMLMAVDELRNGEAGPREYGALGKVRAVGRITATRGAGPRLELRLRIAPGWHVNAHRPLQPELLPTVLELADGADGDGWRLGTVRYPQPEKVRLAFQQEPLAVYRDSVVLSGDLLAAREAPRPRQLAARLRFQACDDRACLQPETLLLELALPRAGAARPRGRAAGDASGSARSHERDALHSEYRLGQQTAAAVGPSR
jgi:hypothetical protein